MSASSEVSAGVRGGAYAGRREHLVYFADMAVSSRKLSVKLVCVALAFLMVALAGIGFTLYESWKLESSAAVINDLGSQRMRSYRIAYLVPEALRAPRGTAAAELRTDMKAVDEMLVLLQRGDLARPPQRRSSRV